MLSNHGLCVCTACALRVTIFSTGGKFWFQILRSYKPPILTSVMIIIAGTSLSEQHTDLLIYHCTKQDLSRTSRYLGIT